jgi:IS5 family transposase
MIIKSRREIEFGHKISLSCGQSGMILDLVIENGNPSDSKLALVMADRLKEIYGK